MKRLKTSQRSATLALASMTQRILNQAITKIARQVVTLVQPERIVLFGSAATGQFQAASDLDLLVIVPDGAEPAAVTDRLNTQLRHKPVPCDFLVVTPAILRRHRHNRGLLYQQILREGRVVYARAG